MVLFYQTRPTGQSLPCTNFLVLTYAPSITG
jgi:hypothetical protein